MTDQDPLLHKLLTNRHNPEETLKALLFHAQDHRASSKAGAELAQELLSTIVNLVNVVHMLCHKTDDADTIINDLLMGEPFTGGDISVEDLMKPETLARLHKEFTEGTDPLDRVWGMKTGPGGAPVITLDGPGFNQRVMFPLGAPPEVVKEIRDKLRDIENPGQK